jgi:hypothetical protein
MMSDSVRSKQNCCIARRPYAAPDVRLMTRFYTTPLTTELPRESLIGWDGEPDPNWGTDMSKLANMILAWLIAVTFVAAPVAVFARARDNPNYGFCKSGKRVTNIQKCKENGGKL